MTRGWKKKALPVMLAGAMVFSFGPVTYADTVQTDVLEVKFNDIEGHWAQSFIENMAGNEIINGFPDATFRPDVKVTKLQAVTIVTNLLSQKRTLETTGTDYIGEVPEWARNSVELALYNDIVSWEDIQDYQAEASRMFIVELLVHALGAEIDAVQEHDLTFTDLTDLSADEQAYLAIALENKFVEGYQDNTFRPGNSVTRAEMAVFADRLFNTLEDEYDFEEGFERVEVVTGKISRIAADVRELTIGSATFGVADDYTVQINDKDASFEDLKTTMNVRVVLKNQKMAEIYAYSTEKEVIKEIVTGSISSIDRNNRKVTVGLKSFDVANGVRIEVNGEVAGFSNLETGMETVVVIANEEIESIFAFRVAEQSALEFSVKREWNDRDTNFKEAVLTGDRVNDATPDLEGKRLRISVDGSRFREIDLDEIDGRQRDGAEVAKLLQAAIEDALDDRRVKVEYKNTRRFVFETTKSPIDEVPTIQFDGDADVLDALGIDDDEVKGASGERIRVWNITVEADATKDQEFEMNVIIDDENIDETVRFSVKRGDSAEEIADAIADALLDKAKIRSALGISVKRDVLTLTPDDEDWDVEIEIKEK
ncbi:S-layer homology domain-containing protein [Halalkalibacter oceani]|uniref:S-layer homology domain-containing protein n=1 Tax=Halalkalibacter oceani TaxID=1653776 RepID=UPI00339A34F3